MKPSGFPFFLSMLLSIHTITTAGAAEAGKYESYIVGTAWLAEMIEGDRDSLVIMHVGAKPEYDAAHIAGAQHVTHADLALAGREGVPLELRPLDEYREILRNMGIDDGSQIILYYGRDWLTAAARIYWTLDHLGLGGQKAILDGGFAAWQAEGRPVTTEPPPVRRGNFTPRPRGEILTNADWILANLKNPEIILLDARTADFYLGENDGRGRYPHPGHIPGAVNIPYSSLTKDDLSFESVDSLRQLFRNSHALPGKRLVAYCHIGLQASLVYFTAKSLGYEIALYDGSFTEWTKNNLPVEKTSHDERPPR